MYLNLKKKAEFQQKEKVKLPQQFAICERELIPIAIVIGSGEIESGTIGIKDQRQKSKQVIIQRSEMVEVVKQMLENK